MIKTLSSVARSTAKMYFEPLLLVRDLIMDTPGLEPSERSGSGSATKELGLTKWFSIVDEAMCLNQSLLMEYSRTAVQHLSNIRAENLKKNKDAQLLLQSTQGFIEHLDDEFKKLAEIDFGYLSQYFSGRGPVGPRVCIKGCAQVGETQMVIPIMRDTEANYASDVDIGFNTSFRRVCESGRYYLNNNIVEGALTGEYQNARFDPEAISRYVSSIKGFSKTTAKKWASRITNWPSFWRDGSIVEDPTAFYKSVIVTPIALVNDHKHLNYVFDKIRSGKRTINSIIFGFLCLDHIDIDFFDEERDIRVCDVFANLLSYFVTTRLLYAESLTFKKALRYLEENQTRGRIRSNVFELHKARQAENNDNYVHNWLQCKAVDRAAG